MEVRPLQQICLFDGSMLEFHRQRIPQRFPRQVNYPVYIERRKDATGLVTRNYHDRVIDPAPNSRVQAYSLQKGCRVIRRNQKGVPKRPKPLAYYY